MGFAATLVLVLPSVLHGSKEGQLRGSNAKNVSDRNATSLPVTESNDTAPSALRTTYGYGEQFRFKADTRYCLSVDGNWFRNGQNMQLWECSRSSGQLFTWNNGLVQAVQDPRFCVVIDGNKNQDGANIQLWQCDPNNFHMHWEAPPFANGPIANKVGGRCMMVEMRPGYNPSFNGVNVQLWSCPGNEAYKQWSTEF